MTNYDYAQAALDAEKYGVTSERQKNAMARLNAAGVNGLTVEELRADENGIAGHHGSASGTLSLLHKAGAISRLSDTRHGCMIYVSNHFVMGRHLSPHRSNGRVVTKQEVLDVMIKHHSVDAVTVAGLIADMVNAK